MSAGFDPVVLSAQISEIPEELKSSSKPKPIPLSRAQMAVPSQSATQNAGGQVLFQLNSSNGFIKPGSVMLKCRVTLVSTGGATNGNTVVAWANAVRNSSSIIDRFTVSSGAVLESINNYGSSYVPTLLLHCANQPYTQNDDALLEGAKRPVTGVATEAGVSSANTNGWRDVVSPAPINTVNTYVDVCIPLYSNLFQNEQGYPLCLLAQNTMVQLDLAQFGKAFYIFGDANNTATDFQVSNAFLIYDLIQPSAEYIMALKDQMRQGMLYQIPFVSALGSQFAKQGQSTTVNWGVGCSSLKGVTYSCLVAPSTLGNAKYLISDNAVNGAGANFRLFIDGQQSSSIIQDTSSSRYACMSNVFGLIGDVNRSTSAGGEVTYNTTAYTVSPTTYEANYFVGGASTQKTNGQLAMTGVQCNNLSFIVETSANTATVIYANCWHDRIMIIDSNGTASIVI
jgi:hypothetical protein